MISSKIENNTLIIEVDTSIYSETVICKTLYWLTSDFIICRSKGSGENIQRIEFKLKHDVPNYNWDNLVSDLSANSDSFVEFNFND